MIFFSLQIIFKKSNCELYILHVLAILGDNKTSCLFWAMGQGWGVGGDSNRKKYPTSLPGRLA